MHGTQTNNSKHSGTKTNKRPQITEPNQKEQIQRSNTQRDTSRKEIKAVFWEQCYLYYNEQERKRETV